MTSGEFRRSSFPAAAPTAFRCIPKTFDKNYFPKTAYCGRTIQLNEPLFVLGQDQDAVVCDGCMEAYQHGDRV